MDHTILNSVGTCGHSNPLPSSFVFHQGAYVIRSVQFHWALELLGFYEIYFHFIKYSHSPLNETDIKV